MTSAIDPSQPVPGTPTTAAVRSNFATAASEITALQASLAGVAGTITGVTAGAGLAGGGTSGAVTVSLTSPVAIANGGTGATTAAAARAALGAAAVGGDTITGPVSAPSITVSGGGTPLTVSSGNISVAGEGHFGSTVLATRYGGGGGGVGGGAGNLNTYGTSDYISFRYNGYANGKGISYRVNDAWDAFLPLSLNVTDLQYASPGGGGYFHGVLNFSEAVGGSAYTIWVDATSDERLKQNIADTKVDALALLGQLPVREFDWRPEMMARSGATEPHVRIGLVGQELEQLAPEAVYLRDDDTQVINLKALVPYLVRAVQQLSARVAELEASAE